MSASIRLAPHALLLAVVVPLVAGGVIGFAVRGALDEPVEVPEDAGRVVSPQPVASVMLPDATSSVARADAESLRARVRELEKLLDAREARLAELAGASAREPAPRPPTEEQAAEAPGEPRRPREGFRERMERMKTEEPERYAEMQKRQEEFRARMRAASEARDTYLSSVDTSRMTAEQKSSHERLLAALKARDAFMERMRPDAENPLTDEERQEFFASMREIGPLMAQERRYLLEETGRAYGEEGAEFADYIQEIFDNTSDRPPMGRGRGPRFGGGRGGSGGDGPGGGRGGEPR